MSLCTHNQFEYNKDKTKLILEFAKSKLQHEPTGPSLYSWYQSR